MKSTLAVSVLLLRFAHPTLAEDDIETVKGVLRSPRREDTRWPWEEHADDLKPFGERAVPLLATLLSDSRFTLSAAETMLVIDADKAAPFLFGSIPPADRNFQKVVFGHFLRRVYRGEKLPFLDQMHDAAVRCLTTGTNADAAEVAIYVLGVSGTTRDFDLLESYLRNQHSTPFWRSKLRNAGEAALARLGSSDALASIERQLSAVPTSPPDRAEAETLTASILKAGYSRNSRFVPFLARLLDAPRPPENPYDDAPPPVPSYYAGVALDQIVAGAPSDALFTKRDWKAWWKENQSKYAK